MKIVLTVVLAAIFLAAVWSGYRRGLILSAAQLAAIVVALYGAALLAGLFYDRLLPVADPRRNTPSSALPPPASPAGRRGAWPAPRSPCATSRTSRCEPP